MDENEWPNVPDSIAGLRDAFTCQAPEHRVHDLSMYLSQLGGALWRDKAALPFEVLQEHGLAVEVFEALREALRHTEADTRATACLALDYLRDPAAVTDLRPMIDDSDHMVVVRATEALRSFGEPTASLVPRLIEVLSFPE
jgi:hypothetical protein